MRRMKNAYIECGIALLERHSGRNDSESKGRCREKKGFHHGVCVLMILG